MSRRTTPIAGIGDQVRSANHEESRTKQAFASESDINRIVKNHTEGAHILPPTRQPLFGDVSMATDLLSARLLLQAAEEDFSNLPADVREVAKNDPVTFLSMLSEQTGAQALVDAGLPIEGLKRSEPAPLPPRQGVAEQQPAAGTPGSGTPSSPPSPEPQSS